MSTFRLGRSGCWNGNLGSSVQTSRCVSMISRSVFAASAAPAIPKTARLVCPVTCGTRTVYSDSETDDLVRRDSLQGVARNRQLSPWSAYPVTGEPRSRSSRGECRDRNTSHTRPVSAAKGQYRERAISRLRSDLSYLRNPAAAEKVPPPSLLLPPAECRARRCR